MTWKGGGGEGQEGLGDCYSEAADDEQCWKLINMRAQSIDKQREREWEGDRESSGWQSETVSVSETEEDWGETETPSDCILYCTCAFEKSEQQIFKVKVQRNRNTHSKMQPQCEWVLKGGTEEEGQSWQQSCIGCVFSGGVYFWYTDFFVIAFYILFLILFSLSRN